MQNIFKKIFIFLFVFLLFFAVGNSVFAQVNTGLNELSGIGLSDTDPRIVVANIIRVLLGFLGIIALLLILYAGFLWTTSAGDSSKIDKAKKILTSAIIGLLIILSAFAIATFILGSLLNSTGGGAGGGGGGGTIPGPGSGIGGAVSCDGNSLTPVCDPDETFCATGDEFCEPTSCTCQPLGGFGDPCDMNTIDPACFPDDTMCVSGLACDTTDCLCYGAPIIDWVSPVNDTGGPNGAIGDFVTIGGRFFGTTTGEVYFSDASGNITVLASFPDIVNPNCNNNWTDRQIVVVVPTGASEGPIRVVRAVDSEEDTTDNFRGPLIPDFLINTEGRAGLCLANPASGFYEDNFTLEGASFSGTTQGVYFGNLTSSTTAININTWTNTSVNAGVPNLRRGANTVFVSVDDSSSNALRFIIEVDSSRIPIISSILPDPAPPGQYVTITGSNFGTSYLSGTSGVTFTRGADSYVALDTDFPEECRNTWWTNRYIIVKVPEAITANFGEYDVVVTNRSGFLSEDYPFEIINASPGPGICAIDPRMGPVGRGVRIIGDNFTSIPGTISFYNGINAASFSWINQYIDSSVPVGAETGPVNVTTASDSNPFPFTVGTCSSNDECFSTEECCGASTYWDGICRISGGCNEGAPITETGYGWTFTSVGNTSTTTATSTCSGWSGGNACLADSESCPNSPGECQTNSAPITGFCGDNYCEALSGCGAGNCEYDITTNRCLAVAGGSLNLQNTCHSNSSSVFSGYEATCNLVNSIVGQTGAWQIQSAGSCPAGTYQDVSGWCTVGNVISGPLTCDLCSSGFSCLSGQCVKGGPVCNNSSTCNSATGFCEGGATCECCCEVGANDCCLGTTCESGGCGSGGPDYGLCTGCRVEDGANNTSVSPSEQLASDLACNCTGTTGKYCFIDLDPASATYSPTGSCLDITAPTGGGLGDSCNLNGPDAPICDPDPTGCLAGLSCDTNSCTCQPEKTLPGAYCVNDLTIGVSNLFTCNPFFPCGTGYSCLSTPIPATSATLEGCGRCCCDPTIPQTIITTSGKTLTCQADKGPCSGSDRGLYCGCSADNECGDSSFSACGTDTCCWPRPEVVASYPPDNSTNVCRNTMLEAVFNTKMNLSAFRGNFVLLGDYGNSSCPEGTQYLSLEKELENKNETKNILVRTLNNFKNKISLLLFGEANAYQSVNITNNFCAIQGRTDSYNNTSGQGVVNFYPNRALDGNVLHYAMVIGDNNLSDNNPSGVLSIYGVGMGLSGTDTEIFNTKEYKNSFIWSFTTLSDQGERQGICAVDYVSVTPSSYLIQTTANSLVEDDTNPMSISFDSVKDSDKRLVARAMTSDGERLFPIPGVYEWLWSWTMVNPAVIDFEPVVDLPDNHKLVRAKITATEGRSQARATANISGSMATSMETKTGVSNLYLFLCNNPWPQFQSTGEWFPWSDRSTNCSILPDGSCDNANHEFYYCRDRGSENTYDDLPAILNEAVIRGRDSGQNLLKEYYFFRENVPDLSAINLAIASISPEGRSVNIWWDNFVPQPGEILDQFLVYYGTRSGNYTQTFSVGPMVPHSLTTPVNISGLDDGKTYYFAITAVYKSGAESRFSNEINAVPRDTILPTAPTITLSLGGDAEAEIEWTDISDAVSYRVYWKAGSSCTTATPPDCYASSESVGNATGVVITDLTNDTVYYFAVTATDASGNQSTYSNEVSVTPAIAFNQEILNKENLVTKTENITENKEESGMVAGAFEENEDIQGNRVNLFGNIVKYILKKISYGLVNKTEAYFGD